MTDDTDKKVIKLVTKDKPPEDTPGVTPDDLLKESLGSFEDVILIGWNKDHFKVAWSESFSPEEVYLQLDLAKSKIMEKLYQF